MMKALIVLVTVLAVGCATSTYVPTSYYAIDPQISVEQAPPIDATIGLRPLSSPRTYSKGIVAREADLEVVYIPHVSWTEEPHNMVARALTDAIAGTQRFEDVGNAADMFAPTYVLTGQLRRFDILREETPWQALCEVRLELRAGQKREPVWQDTLQVSVPVQGEDVSAAARALSQAVAELATSAANAIVAATPAGV
jgi:ABC-type uncharacterized transport system auxiliary subunit